MTHLPEAEAATVDEGKVRLYLLNAAHPQNGGKATFFQSFGFSPMRWHEMAASLCNHPLTNHLVGKSISAHGTKHVVRCSMWTPDGRNPCITTVWMTQADLPPRLVTAYP